MLHEEIQVFSRGPGWLFVHWRQVYLLDWRCNLTRQNLDASLEGSRALARAYPEGFVTINILHPPLSMPPNELRSYAQKKMAESPTNLVAHATALTESGFWSSAFRAALAGMFLVEKTPFPRRVFGRIDEAVGWVGDALTADQSWRRAAERVATQVMASCEQELANASGS